MMSDYSVWIWFLFGMVGMLLGIVMILSAIGNLITLPIIIFLLRKRRDYLIDKLDTYAPKKVQGWAHFPSFAWIRSSQQAFSWFTRHSKEDIQHWRKGIKKELGSVYWLYRINTECLRFGFLSVSFFFVFMVIEYKFGIVGIPFSN